MRFCVDWTAARKLPLQAVQFIGGYGSYVKACLVWYGSAVLATCSLWSLNIFIGDMVFAEDQDLTGITGNAPIPTFGPVPVCGAPMLHQLFIWGDRLGPEKP